MSLLHTCYELAKNLLSTCYASPRSKFIFCAKEYRISDASYSYDRKKTCKDSTILAGLFCCAKSWKNVASEPLKPQDFVADFPNMSRTSAALHKSETHCFASVMRQPERVNSKSSAVSNVVKPETRKLKVQFWKAPIKGFALENPTGKGKN